MLQRRLRIGYNRAARLMELLEARGVVGPENGAQPREILADLDSL
jgi:S-DNA-T family DNA segregation ATPase FtsK/SpoIIIE